MPRAPLGEDTRTTNTAYRLAPSPDRRDRGADGARSDCYRPYREDRPEDRYIVEDTYRPGTEYRIPAPRGYDRRDDLRENRYILEDTYSPRIEYRTPAPRDRYDRRVDREYARENRDDGYGRELRETLESRRPLAPAEHVKWAPQKRKAGYDRETSPSRRKRPAALLVSDSARPTGVPPPRPSHPLPTRPPTYRGRPQVTSPRAQAPPFSQPRHIEPIQATAPSHATAPNDDVVMDDSDTLPEVKIEPPENGEVPTASRNRDSITPELSVSGSVSPVERVTTPPAIVLPDPYSKLQVPGQGDITPPAEFPPLGPRSTPPPSPRSVLKAPGTPSRNLIVRWSEALTLASPNPEYNPETGTECQQAPSSTSVSTVHLQPPRASTAQRQLPSPHEEFPLPDPDLETPPPPSGSPPQDPTPPPSPQSSATRHIPSRSVSSQPSAAPVPSKSVSSQPPPASSFRVGQKDTFLNRFVAQDKLNKTVQSEGRNVALYCFDTRIGELRQRVKDLKEHIASQENDRRKVMILKSKGLDKKGQLKREGIDPNTLPQTQTPSYSYHNPGAPKVTDPFRAFDWLCRVEVWMTAHREYDLGEIERYEKEIAKLQESREVVKSWGKECPPLSNSPSVLDTWRNVDPKK